MPADDLTTMEQDTKPSLQLNSIDTIRLLNLIARKYYHNDDGTFHHEAYLRDCFKCLLTFFSTELYVGESAERENVFLFAALTYKKEDSTRIELVKLDDGLGYYFNKDAEAELAALFNPVIEELYKAIYKKKSMSVTETLLKDKRRGKDLFLYSGKPYETPVDPSNEDVDARIAFFRLSDLAFVEDESIEKFCKSNSKQIGEFKKSLNKNSEIDVADSDQQIGTLLWYYRQLQEKYLLKHQDKEFLVHFIRPSFIEFGYNILLSLGTNSRLNVDQLSLIYLLVYRIVSQTVIEKTKEAEKLKRKKSYSLTSHSFKTELSTTIIPQVNLVVDTIKESALYSNPKLNEHVDVLLEQSKELFRLTGLISLIDKIDKRDEFLESGHRDELISTTQEFIKIADYCSVYNLRHPNLDDIVVRGYSTLSITVFDEFLSGQLIRLFYKTLFENIIIHGRRVDNKVYLDVSQTPNGYSFENETRKESFVIDDTKLTGNLLLFKTFIEETGSGKLHVKSENHKFNVVYESGNKNEQH